MIAKIIKILDVIASNKELEAFENRVLDKIIPIKAKEETVQTEEVDIKNASEVDA